MEWPPFRAAIRAGVASLMTAHLALPAIDASGRPATLSPAVITGVLRREMGFTGLIVTDALLMGGVTTIADPAAAAVEALAAGCDLLLMPPDPAAAFTAVQGAVETGRLPEERLYEAAGRVLAAKARVGTPPSAPPTPSAAALAQAVATGAVTLAKGPLPAFTGVEVVAVALDDGANPESLAAWEQSLQLGGIGRHLTITADASPDAWQVLIEQIKQLPVLLLGLFSPIRASKDRSLLPERLLEPLQRLIAAHPTVVVSFSSPFLVTQFPGAAAWVLAYGATPLQIATTTQAVLAGGPLPGRLPIDLPETLAAVPEGPSDYRRDGPAFA